MKSNQLVFGVLLTISLTAVAAGCSQNTLDLLGRSFIPNTIAVQSVTDSSYHQVILPGYRNFLTAARQLDEQVKTYVKNPEDPQYLAAVQNAWKSASVAWVMTEAYQFGPATEERLRQNIAYWPRRTEHIQSVLTGNEPIVIQELGTSRKGLPVLEYLLFGEVPALSDPGRQRYDDYVQSLSTDLVKQADTLLQHWQTGDYGANYLNSPNAANMQLNQWVVLLENIKNKRLGEPAGFLGTALGEDALEAPESDYSLELLKAALDGFARSYTLEGLSIQASAPDTGEYLVALGHRQVHQQVSDQLKKLRADLEGLGPSLKQALNNNPEAVEASYEDVKTLLRYVKVDLANALNQTVNFTDNDGD
jgi:uncharacterized protein